MLAIVIAASGALNMPCAELKNIELERATITSAVDVAAGLFKPANAPANPPAQSGPPSKPIPQHCRVTMVLKPTADSNINVELWLPTDSWNGKFLAVGNGGWAGSIQGYADMQDALRRGYATAGTDTGHSAADGPVESTSYSGRGFRFLWWVTTLPVDREHEAPRGRPSWLSGSTTAAS